MSTEAFRNLREAVEIRDPFFALLALHWPPLARARAEPEFVQILREIGWDRPLEARVLPSLASHD